MNSAIILWIIRFGLKKRNINMKYKKECYFKVVLLFFEKEAGVGNGFCRWMMDS